MAYSSDHDLARLTTLTSRLTPRTILDLSCDILFSRGHQQIRITDGPGDGARDIHSLTSTGERHITQCKHHKNVKSNTSSSELDELPRALLKMSATHGLFVTTTQITPQQKREYLNEYTNFRLDFLDGITLIREISSDNILRAKWIENSDPVWPHIFSIPFVVRYHENDLPILLTRQFGEKFGVMIIKQINDALTKKQLSTKIKIEQTLVDASLFPYLREPKLDSLAEVLGSRVICTILHFENIPSLADIPTIQSITERVLSKLIAKVQARFSIVFGITYIISSKRPQELLTRITTEQAFISPVIHTPHAQTTEQKFYTMADHPEWTLVNDARVTEADHIRLYSPLLNVSLAHNIRSQPSWSYRVREGMTRRNAWEAWRISVHALINFNPKEWPKCDYPPPDDSILWPWNNNYLCIWWHHHPPQSSAIITTLPDGAFIPNTTNQQEENERLRKISEYITNNGFGSLVDPKKARHMLATVSYDPFEVVEERIYNTAILSLEDQGDPPPSPILPEFRSFVVSIFAAGITESEFNLMVSTHPPDPDISITDVDVAHYPDLGLSHFRINLNFAGINDAPTSNLLSIAHRWLAAFLSSTKSSYPELSIQTKSAWKALTSVTLGQPWYESDLEYVNVNIDGHDVPLTGKDNPLDSNWVDAARQKLKRTPNPKSSDS